MRAPTSLGAAGRAAFRRAARSVADAEDADRFYEAVARVAHAVDLADRARRQWRKLGQPLVKESGSAVHPLVVVMQDAERDAARFERALVQLRRASRSSRPGPDPVATMRADIGPAPSKLRRVK